MKDSYAERYAGLEAEHWWFRARRRVLGTILEREIAWGPGTTVLDIGVGSGGNLALYPAEAQVLAVEPDARNAARAAARGRAVVLTGSLEDLPAELGERRFDVVALFDVLEHLVDDLGGLQIVRERLAPGGRAVLSVPAHPWLWGQQDIVSQHQRRYTRPELERKLEETGFRVRRATYFNTLLFAPIALFRLAARWLSREADSSDFEVGPRWAGAVLYRIFAAEGRLLERIDLPFGLSLLVVVEAA